MRVCLVYDHLFPQTIGGTERWLRDLALRLSELGHDVTYLTMRHWDSAAPPSLPGVRILGLTRPGSIYGRDRRTVGAPLRFGIAVARHLFRHGGDYDVVHTAAFPYFPLLAAGALRRSSSDNFLSWVPSRLTTHVDASSSPGRRHSKYRCVESPDQRRPVGG